MTEIMPVPRILSFTVLPAGGLCAVFLVELRGIEPLGGGFIKMA